MEIREKLRHWNYLSQSTPFHIEIVLNIWTGFLSIFKPIHLFCARFIKYNLCFVLISIRNVLRREKSTHLSSYHLRRYKSYSCLFYKAPKWPQNNLYMLIINSKQSARRDGGSSQPGQHAGANIWCDGASCISVCRVDYHTDSDRINLALQCALHFPQIPISHHQNIPSAV